MIYDLKFSIQSERVAKKWKKSNPIVFKKYSKILAELVEHPRTGIGHPEPLVGGGNITWSRRITAHDRIIYDIYDDIVEVHIIEVGGHYNDK